MNDLESQTLAQIQAARTLQGRPPQDYLVPWPNIGGLLDHWAATQPDKIWMIHYDQAGTREEWTYAAFNARANQIAHFLAEWGVKRGDRVATIAYNHSETALIYFACWKLGAAVAPQNVTEDDKRIAYILRNSEAVLALVRPEYLDRAENIIHNPAGEEGLGAENIREIIQFGGPAGATYQHLDSALATISADFTPPSLPTLEDEALLVYTSGTTGAPKGVVLMHYNLLVDAYGISQWQQITQAQRLMCVLPIHHVNGIVMTIITSLYVGGSLVLNRAYSSQHFWERLAREGVQVVSVVPTLLQFSLEYAEQQAAAGHSIYGGEVTKKDLAGLRYLACGAGTLPITLAKNFEETFGFRILHGYGLSETTCYSCHLPPDIDEATHQAWMRDYGYPSIGCPIPTNEMSIFDPSGSGQELPEGEKGEICIRGHNVMTGYFKRPDANAETFKFAWFRSGDEGFYKTDEQGRRFFFITGRIKELINRGGVKFSPFDIEEVLLEHPAVKVGLAIAFENLYYGEEVGAYIVLKEGAQASAEDLIAHCRARMSFEKSPKAIVFGTEIPVTTTGKYQRLKLQALFAEWRETQFKK